MSPNVESEPAPLMSAMGRKLPLADGLLTATSRRSPERPSRPFPDDFAEPRSCRSFWQSECAPLELCVSDQFR